MPTGTRNHYIYKRLVTEHNPVLQSTLINMALAMPNYTPPPGVASIDIEDKPMSLHDLAHAIGQELEATRSRA